MSSITNTDSTEERAAPSVVNGSVSCRPPRRPPRGGNSHSLGLKETCTLGCPRSPRLMSAGTVTWPRIWISSGSRFSSLKNSLATATAPVEMRSSGCCTTPQLCLRLESSCCRHSKEARKIWQPSVQSSWGLWVLPKALGNHRRCKVRTSG